MGLSSLHKKIYKYSRKPEVVDKIVEFGKSKQPGRGDYLTEMANGGRMYCYLYAAAKVLKPKQIVELGADCGASTVSLSMGSPKDAVIYSVEVREGGWEYVGEDRKVVKITGNYMDMKIWPEKVNLEDTDIWFFDGNHALDHVREQIDIYEPYFKEGTYLMFDDTKFYMGAFENRKWRRKIVTEVHGNEFVVGLV